MTEAFLRPTYALWLRELIRFARDRSRLLGSILQPAILWVLVGAGFAKSFASPTSGPAVSGDYLTYIYPGILMLIVLFTAIFSTISVVEDRREGFLQGVLVAPISSCSIAVGKILGGTTMAVGEGVVFLAIAPFLGVDLNATVLAKTVGVLFLVAFGLTALGFRIAWGMTSTAGFHAVMNLILMPMWLLSGAFFPVTGAATWLTWVMRANPMTYAMALLRSAVGMGAPEADGLPSEEVCLEITLVLTATVVAWSAVSVARSRS